MKIKEIILQAIVSVLSAQPHSFEQLRRKVTLIVAEDTERRLTRIGRNLLNLCLEDLKTAGVIVETRKQHSRVLSMTPAGAAQGTPKTLREALRRGIMFAAGKDAERVALMHVTDFLNQRFGAAVLKVGGAQSRNQPINAEQELLDLLKLILKE